MVEREILQRIAEPIAAGWNTWNTHSVLGHVLLPRGFALMLGIKEYRSGKYLTNALMGRRSDGDEVIVAGPKTYDGRYSSLTIKWEEIELEIESANEERDVFIKVTSVKNQLKPAAVVIEAGFLWNFPGTVLRTSDGFTALSPEEADIDVRLIGNEVPEAQIPARTTYLAVSTAQPIRLYTGSVRSEVEVDQIIERRRHEQEQSADRFGDSREVYEALQTCCAWDTIYDPSRRRVITPVSRRWNCTNGGFVLFCWDTFFSSYLISLEDRDLAYANALEMLGESVVVNGRLSYVPNTSNGHGFKTLDRSQPPVGSMMVREIYRRFREPDFVNAAFDSLLAWNRWWPVFRDVDGLLCWGSNRYEPRSGNYWETSAGGVGNGYGAALESGLDNSPMYDGVPFDSEREVLQLHDVGLNSLYVADCDALTDLAAVIGRTAEQLELRTRAQAYREGLQRLWCDELGMFLNRRTDTGQFSRRMSPTLFYPFLANAPTNRQASHMVEEHLLNPREFGGTWPLPSVARSDPAYAQQDYWRGRVWPPMNFLVYLGLRRYSRLSDAQAWLAKHSSDLILREWRSHRHVHENYSAETGEGCDRANSDAFYHWGGLLGAIGLIENGCVTGPEQPL